LEEADELFALWLREGLKDIGYALEVVGDDFFDYGAALGGEADVDGAAVCGVGLAGYEAVFLEGVDEAGHGGARDAGVIGEGGGGGGGGGGGVGAGVGVAFHAEEHEDSEAALADVVAGKEAVDYGEDVVTGAKEVEEGVAGAGLKGGTELGGLDEAVEAREVLEHQEGHGGRNG
jgi:hypothetical protein